MSDNLSIPEILEKKLIHKGNILTFFKYKMKFENGNTADWDFLHHNGAASVVAVTDDDKILMVKQYRPGCNRITLEIPAGCTNEDEDRKTAAARELEEETGFKCNKIEVLNKFYPAMAYCDEYIEIYLATELTKSKQNLDENEFVEVEAYDIEKLVDMIIKCEIQDSKTIIGIMTYYARLNRK